MSARTKHPSKRELIDYLKHPGRQKYTSCFADPNGGEGRCCLGHYADMIGLSYPSRLDLFQDSHLPPGHWLLAEPSADQLNLAPRADATDLQELLAIVNDETEGFDTVIKVLEA